MWQFQIQDSDGSPDLGTWRRTLCLMLMMGEVELGVGLMMGEVELEVGLTMTIFTTLLSNIFSNEKTKIAKSLLSSSVKRGRKCSIKTKNGLNINLSFHSIQTIQLIQKFWTQAIICSKDISTYLSSQNIL